MADNKLKTDMQLVSAALMDLLYNDTGRLKNVSQAAIILGTLATAAGGLMGFAKNMDPAIFSLEEKEQALAFLIESFENTITSIKKEIYGTPN